MKKARYSVFILAICGALWWFWPINENRVMNDFMYGTGRMESQLTIPLQRAGSSILPRLLEEIQNKEMPRRRYAIGFTGDKFYRPALPVLQKILEDKTEIWYFRADALEAIFRIDPELATHLSPSYIDEKEWLGRFARNIRDKKPLLSLD